MEFSERSVAGFVLYRLRWALVGIGAVLVASTVGYMQVEDYSFLDAFYMTAITLGTIGYGEVRPLDTAGRIMTIGVIVASFTTLVYMASVLTELFASGEATVRVRRKRKARILDNLDHHVIVVGFGRVGQSVVDAFTQRGRHCVVLDSNPDHGPAITAAGAVQFVGDATDEAALRQAGIDRADALVAAANEDADNLVIVLTARSVRADLRIVSRVNQATWLGRMKAAGADVAESPYPSYGAKLANAALDDDAHTERRG